MNLLLQRETATEKSTIGSLRINGEFFCWTLEDKLRDQKVFGQTAIPSGTYQVIIDFSNRFQKPMPHILNVPGFSGIRIHPGNTDKDTEGCILIGLTKSDDFIGKSQMAFQLFMPKLQSALQDNLDCWIEIKNP